MQKIKNLQLAFHQSILEDSNQNLDFIKSSYPKERFNIYRQSIFENMRNALAATYPGIWVLLGETCANNAAHIFLNNRDNLPSSGCLDDWGKGFIEFLNQQKELQSLDYLKDYASYEWLKHLSYGAKQAEAIQITDLASIPQEKIISAKFIFLPSMFLFSSDFPINEIQELTENIESKNINLSSNKSYAIIACLKNEIITFWITNDLWSFVLLLTKGFNITEASGLTERLYPNFNLTTIIHFLLEKQLITKIITEGEN